MESTKGYSKEEMADLLKEGIKEKLGMTVYAFVHSDLPKKWGIRQKASTIKQSLAKGSASEDLFRKIAKGLGIGALTAHTKRIIVTTYFLD